MVSVKESVPSAREVSIVPFNSSMAAESRCEIGSGISPQPAGLPETASTAFAP